MVDAQLQDLAPPPKPTKSWFSVPKLSGTTMDFLGLDKYVDKYFLEAFSEHVCCKAFKGAVQGDRDPTDALVAKYNQAGLQ